MCFNLLFSLDGHHRQRHHQVRPEQVCLLGRPLEVSVPSSWRNSITGSKQNLSKIIFLIICIFFSFLSLFNKRWQYVGVSLDSSRQETENKITFFICFHPREFKFANSGSTFARDWHRFSGLIILFICGREAHTDQVSITFTT